MEIFLQIFSTERLLLRIITWQKKKYFNPSHRITLKYFNIYKNGHIIHLHTLYIKYNKNFQYGMILEQ